MPARVVLLVKGTPWPDAVSGGALELILDVVVLTFSCMASGLLTSAQVKSSEQTMPLQVVVVIVQLVATGAGVSIHWMPTRLGPQSLRRR